MPATDLFP